MEKVLEQALPEVTKTIEVPVELPLLEPESNGYGKDVGIVIAGVIAAAVLYKLWLKYGKK